METSQERAVSLDPSRDRFDRLPDDETLAATIVALEAHGMSVQSVEDLDEARRVTLARIPEGASVMTFPSVTLEEAGITDAIDGSGTYDSVRAKVTGLDRVTQMREIKASMVLPDFALGSVHAITRDGTLLLASALGSQLAAHAWGAERVIFVAGAQKLVPDLEAAQERVYRHSLALEDARALETYGSHSRAGKLLEIREEDPERIHLILVRQKVGF